MKKLAFLAPLLAALTGGVHASPPLPQGAPGQPEVKWRGISKIPGGIPEVEYNKISVSVDSEGTAHMLQVYDDPPGQQAEFERIRYFNTRIQDRVWDADAKTSAFSAPVNIFSVPKTGAIVNGEEGDERIFDPDIWVDDADTVHAVWAYAFTADDFNPRYQIIKYAQIPRSGDPTITNLTEPIHGKFYYAPQIVVDTFGRAHVVASYQSDTPFLEQIVHFNGVGSQPTPVALNSSSSASPRIAIGNNKIAVTWFESSGGTNGIHYNVASYGGGGITSWPGKNLLISGFDNRNPDLDIDPSNGDLHFVWSRSGAENQIIHKKGTGPESLVVSDGTSIGEPPNEIYFSQGARVRVINNEVHVFYAGWSHATKSASSSPATEWRRTQPLGVKGIQNKLSDRPMEVAKSQGPRFDLIGNQYYVRSAESKPDAASLYDVFPGAQINTVPLNGGLRYRLKLFSANGLAPSVSLGLSYDSKRVTESALGRGWLMDHLMHLTINDEDNITLTLPNGLSLNFETDASVPGGYTLSEPGFGFAAAIKAAQNGWGLSLPGGRQFGFNSVGQLGQVLDRTGNYMEVQYVGGRATAIVDQLGNGGPGRTTSIEYGGSGSGLEHRIVAVVDPTNKRYEFGYTNGKLTTVTFKGVPEQPTFEFDYNTQGLLSKVRPPEGFAANPKYGYDIEYDGPGRVIRVVDPPEVFVTETEPDGSTPSQGIADVNVFYFNDPADTLTVPRIGLNKFYTRVVDRRENSVVYVFNVQRNYGVSEFWDSAAFHGDNTVAHVTREFDPSFGNVLQETDRYGRKTVYTYVNPISEPNPPAPWLTNLVKTVSKPDPDAHGQTQLVETFTYTSGPIQGEFGKVRTHTTRARATGTTQAVDRTTTFTYNDFGQLTETLFPDVNVPGMVQSGVKLKSFYAGPRRQLTRTEDELGHWTEFGSFHASHGLPQSVLREGGTQTTETRYDLMGNVTMTLSPTGAPGNDIPGWTISELDGLYRPWRITDPAGHQTVNQFDRESRAISVQPPAGGATTTEYDRRGFVKGGSTPDGTWIQFVDAGGNVRRKSSLRIPVTLTFTEYDKLGRVTRVKQPAASSTGSAPWIVTETAYDGGSLGGQRFDTETEVGDTGNPSRVTKAVMDHRGRVLRTEGPDGGKSVSVTHYDEQDQVLAVDTIYDSLVQSSSLSYRDQRDRIWRTAVQNYAYMGTPPANPKVSETTTFLNEVGSVVQIVDPLGNPNGAAQAHKTTHVLDARQRVTYVIDGYANVVKRNIWGDDDLLAEVHVPDPSTKSTDLVPSQRTTYTKRKEIWRVRNADNKGLDYVYGPLQGQVTSVTDALGRVTQTTYHPTTQRVFEVVQSAGHPTEERRTRSEWDRGLLKETWVWNPHPNQQNYTSVFRHFYDEADRLERIQAPLVADELYRYNVFGEEDRFTAGARVIDRTYNSLGQQTQAVYAPHGVTETREYAQGAVGPTLVSNGTCIQTTFYGDNLWLGLPDDETFSVPGGMAWTKLQSHQYDTAKNYTRFFDAEGGEHAWTYDDANRLKTASYKPSGAAEQVVYTLDYTPGGLLDRATCHDASGNSIATTTFYYDVLGRKVGQHTVQHGTGKTLASFEWGYNTVDLITTTTIKHLGLTVSYGYNSRNELTGETLTGNAAGESMPPDDTQLGGSNAGLPESVPSGEAQATPGLLPSVASRSATYFFDRGGNRTTQTIDTVTTTFTYNEASQLVSQSAVGKSVDHLYDELGNEYRRTTNGTTQEDYTYNYLNLLSLYTNSAASTSNTQYAYWPTGERYAKEPVSSGVSELYIPRGGDVATEYSKSGSIVTFKNAYVQGLGTDQKYVRVSQTGEGRRHYIGDQVGTLSVTLTDAGGVHERSLRDAWGVTLQGFGSSERYGFAQREHDAETGLVHMRARQYDPSTGRFTQTDAIQANRPSKHYSYGSNNPLGRIDPFGLDDFPIEEDEKSGLRVVKYWNTGGILPNDDPFTIGLYDDATKSVTLFKEGAKPVTVPYEALRSALSGWIWESGPSTADGWYDWAVGWRNENSGGPYARKGSLNALHQEFAREPDWENRYRGWINAVNDATLDVASGAVPAGKVVQAGMSLKAMMAAAAAAKAAEVAKRLANVKRAATIVRTGEKAIIKYHDELSQLSLRGQSLTSGSKKLRAQGLEERVTKTGRHEFVDKTGRVRVAWDPANSKGGNHWHKFSPDGKPLNNAGHVVDKVEPKAHIPSK